MKLDEDLLIYILNRTDILVNFIQVMFFILFSYYTNYRICNIDFKISKQNIMNISLTLLIATVYIIIKSRINHFAGVVSLVFLIALVFSKDDFAKSIATSIFSVCSNYIVSFISLIIAFVICWIFNINNDYINVTIITVIHLIVLKSIFKIKKFKHGIAFLQKKKQNEYLDILILNISTIILFSMILISIPNVTIIKNISIGIVIFTIMMIIAIQKSLQLYYKQKLLVQELENTKKELAEKTKEIENLEAENIAISKKAHTLDHKQKSLAKKIDEMMINTEISKEEVAEVKERLNKIGQDLYKEKTAVELSKTEIPEIDDMLSYMQSECSANKIDFELQIKGNIHYMTNNLISIEDLETLLADHIKNAIIAINHTDNINRSILVRLGEIDGIYSLYIYDSGIEFAKETLENLGKKPSTTHANEGGTGMGFMNTFDTLRKCKASLIIEELNEPCKDNYTKAIIIKFDNKNEFKVIHKEC